MLEVEKERDFMVIRAKNISLNCQQSDRIENYTNSVNIVK